MSVAHQLRAQRQVASKERASLVLGSSILGAIALLVVSAIAMAAVSRPGGQVVATAEAASTGWTAAASGPLVVPPPGYTVTAAKTCVTPSVIYAPCDDQMQRLADEIATAKSDGKLLLVVLGADWCPWCRSFEQMASGREVLARRGAGFNYRQSFALVNIAVSARDQNGKTRDVASGTAAARLLLARAKDKSFEGIPNVLVVDPVSGKVAQPGDLHTSDDEQEAGFDPAKIRDFLQQAHAGLRPDG